MEVNQITKIAICQELFEAGVPKSHIANKLGLNRETVHIWTKGIEELGLNSFVENYLNSKKGERAKRKIDGLLKSRVLQLREENRGCCGQKIQEYLWNQYGKHLSVETIYKILRTEYKLRSKWKKNQIRGLVPKAGKPREVIQMDTVDFGDIFAFTGIDIFSKDVTVQLYPSLTSLNGLNFLNHSFKTRYKHTNLLQTDGGPEFKAEFKNNVFKFTDRFRVARPYKKNEQSYIESFNRSLRKECLGWVKYKQKDLPTLQNELINYLDYYHDKRAHLGLNLLTPNQVLEKYGVSDI